MIHKLSAPILISLFLVNLKDGFVSRAFGAAPIRDITLKEVCANRHVPIVSLDVARSLIAELHADPSICQESYRQSIDELEPVLMLTKGERICSDRKFNQIKDYHFRYVNPLQETYKLFDNPKKLDKEIKKRPLDAEKLDYGYQLDDFDQEILIPIALQQFFKAWALQVSGMCKKALVDNLERAIQTTMTQEDLSIMGNFIKLDKEKSSSSSSSSSRKRVQLSSAGASFSGIVYMPEVEGFSKDDDKMNKGTAVLDFTNDPQMNKFMHACMLRYKPIYSKLIIPIVRLAKLGYDYMGHQIDSISSTLEKDPTIQRWVALTSLCEAHGEFELVEANDKEPIQMEQLAYEPTIGYNLDNDLWIKGSRALQKEFDRIKGKKSTGLRGLKYKLGVGGRKALAFLDPNQFAWYRKNQLTLANILYFAAFCWNMINFGINMAG